MERRTIGIVLALGLTGLVGKGMIDSKNRPDSERVSANVTYRSQSSEQSLEQMYPAPWIKAEEFSISRALSEAGIKGCHRYRYRVSSGSNTEFLVYCTSGGEATRAFMVWPNIQKVLGPYPPDPSLP